MPGFHSVTHVPTLQQAQSIVRDRVLFGSSDSTDTHSMQVAEFVDNYCENHITTHFPEDLSRLLISAFKAGQEAGSLSMVESGGQIVSDMGSGIRYLIEKAENCERLIEQEVRPALTDVVNWAICSALLVTLALSGVIYVSLMINR